MCSGQGGTEDVSCPSCGGSGFPGRRVVFWDNSKQVKIDLQDDNRTLKVFIEDRSN